MRKVICTTRILLLFTMLTVMLIGCNGPEQRVPKQTEDGYFVGTVRTEWSDNGRDMTLLESFEYVDPSGERWIAPGGCKINGASIPQAAWSYPGGPYAGRYRNASVVHDIACNEPDPDLSETCWGRKRPHEAVHRMFYDAMLAGGVSVGKAQLMYFFVRTFGPRWDTEGNDVASPFGEEESEALMSATQDLNQVLDVDAGDRPARISEVDLLYTRELAERPGIAPTQVPTRDQIRRMGDTAGNLSMFSREVQPTGLDRVNRIYLVARSIVRRDDLSIEELEDSLDVLLEKRGSRAELPGGGEIPVPVDR